MNPNTPQAGSSRNSGPTENEQDPQNSDKIGFVLFAQANLNNKPEASVELINYINLAMQNYEVGRNFVFPKDRISTYLLLPDELSYNNRNVLNSDTGSKRHSLDIVLKYCLCNL